MACANIQPTANLGDVLCPDGYTTDYREDLVLYAKCPSKDKPCNRCWAVNKPKKEFTCTDGKEAGIDVSKKKEISNGVYHNLDPAVSCDEGNSSVMVNVNLIDPYPVEGCQPTPTEMAHLIKHSANCLHGEEHEGEVLFTAAASKETCEAEGGEFVDNKCKYDVFYEDSDGELCKTVAGLSYTKMDGGTLSGLDESKCALLGGAWSSSDNTCQSRYCVAKSADDTTCYTDTDNPAILLTEQDTPKPGDLTPATGTQTTPAAGDSVVSDSGAETPDPGSFASTEGAEEGEGVNGEQIGIIVAVSAGVLIIIALLVYFLKGGSKSGDTSRQVKVTAETTTRRLDFA